MPRAIGGAYARKTVGPARSSSKKKSSPNKKSSKKKRKTVAKTLPKARGPCKHVYRYINYSIPRLKKAAKKRNLTGYSGLNKAQLIQLVGEHKRIAKRTARKAARRRRASLMNVD